MYTVQVWLYACGQYRREGTVFEVRSFPKKTVSPCPSIQVHVVQFQDSILRYSQTGIAMLRPPSSHQLIQTT